MEVWIKMATRKNHFGRHNLLVPTVEVNEKVIDRLETLTDAIGDCLPFGPGDDTRQPICWGRAELHRVQQESKRVAGNLPASPLGPVSKLCFPKLSERRLQRHVDVSRISERV